MGDHSDSPVREEFFDIYDEARQPIGTASRSEVHAKGYWHRSIHCWLARNDNSRKLVMFQLRHADKDTFPSCFDITAAGHLQAGETMEEAARELEEELGIQAAFDTLLPLGHTRKEAVGTARGIPFIDREISEVFGFVYDAPPASLRLQTEEVAGVYEAELAAMIALFEGKTEQLIAEGVEPGPDGVLRESARLVQASSFVPRQASYYIDVFRALLKIV
ncbi:NUDIX domain-containing protein [Paenibacillus solisilvae]|uniref:NUDIX domain-containing protein n=1 Tax=Paenibacillus solisilvae TaxID=2486751 RepID=A0ABW0W084_9BACL